MKKLLLVVLVGVIVVGCGKKDSKTEDISDPRAMIEEFYKSVTASLEDGNTNGAIESVKQALLNDDFKDMYPELFKNLLSLTLRAERAEEAKKIILDAAANNAIYLNKGLGQVCRYYAATSDTNNLLDWTAVLVDTEIQEEFLGTVYSWRMEALYRADKLDMLFAFVPLVINKVSDENAVYILKRYADLLLTSGQYDQQSKLLGIVSGLGKESNILESFVTASQISAFLAQNDYKQAEQLFREHAKTMMDRDVATSFSNLRKSSSSSTEASDQLTLFILKNLHDKPRLISLAAKEWIAAPEKRKQYDLIITRINQLIDMNIASSDILKIYLMQFYKVTGADDKTLISKMMKTGDTLMGVTDENGKQSIRALQLDGSFLLEDYATAVKYIEAGIDGRDEDWHKMALNKVKSHLALKEGRIEDAIAGFREFMSVISEKKEGEVDPASGILYSKEMMLGQNALRIADLYKSINKLKEAALAYEEAADYYTLALEEVKPDSKEYARIQNEIKKLPSGKGSNK